MRDDTTADALEELMRTHADEVYRCCVGMLRDGHLAQDASQETFLRAYRKLGSFRRESSARTWLLTIAMNVCRDMLRKPYARRVIPLAVVEPPSRDDSARWLQDALYTAIQALPDKQRAVILLHCYHDLPCDEVARVLGIRRGTVFSHLRRARAALAHVLQAEGGEIDVAKYAR